MHVDKITVEHQGWHDYDYIEIQFTWEQFVVVCHAQEQRKMIAHITSLWIHQDVPERHECQMTCTFGQCRSAYCSHYVCLPLIAANFKHSASQLPFADLREVFNLPGEFAIQPIRLGFCQRSVHSS